MRLRTVCGILLGVALAVSSGVAPAAAATATPTISAPTSVSGFRTVPITGTATPGATVELYETTVKWHDLAPAHYWQDGSNSLITTVAAANGTYRLSRAVDTGFEFAVEVNGVMSRTVTVYNKLVPVLTVVSGKIGTVTAKLTSTPPQPWISVQIQRKNANGTWSVVARGYTKDPGTFAVVIKQTSKKTYTYRAWMSGDTESGLLAAYSAAHSVKIR